MNTKYLFNNKKLLIVSILLILLVITGIYLLAIKFSSGNGEGWMGGGMRGMMGNVMMGMGGGMNMTGKEVNNMGHRVFPRYKGVKTGPALFRYEGCFMCHTINGFGGGMMVVAPNLSHIGGVRSFSWLAVQIADPSAHFKRNSIVTLNGVKYRANMPSFENMSSKDIGILAKYLESLK